MAASSKYYVITPAADDLNFLDFGLRYGAVSNLGQTIQFNGSSMVDSMFVRPGLQYDLSNTGAGTDKIYLTGNLADYTLQFDSLSQTLTLSRTVGGLGESVKVALGTSLVYDNLIFANGTVSTFALGSAVAASTALPTPSAAETSLAPLGAAASGSTLAATIKAYSNNTAALGQVGETFASAQPGINFITFGGNGIDSVYVADGETVDASVLGASVDLIYMRGLSTDYTKSTLSDGTKLLFTRQINGKTESVTVSAGTELNYDKLIFADGAVQTPWAKLVMLLNPTGSIITDPTTTTPQSTDAEVAAALATISAAAQANNATATSPSALVYSVAGVSGVNSGNLAAINDALNSPSINGIAADTAPEVQAIVNAYSAILASADGISGNTATALTGAQYSAIGVTGVSGTASAGNALFLLNNVLDGKATAAVDTVPEVQALADAAAHVIAAAGGTVLQIAALTQADLTALGVTGVTSGNLTDVLSAIGATTPDTSIDTLAELQAIVSTASNLRPILSSTLGGVGNLEVSSNLVLSVTQTVTIGSGFIRITDLGGAGYQGDTNTNTQTIDVATAVQNGLLTITGTGANTKIIINPQWDLDLASNYQLSIDDGAFLNAAGTVSAAHLTPITFSTVTPGTHTAGTAATEAVASQTMVDSTGGLTAGKSWLDIQGIGNNTGGVTQLGTLSGGSYALVMKNYATARGGDPLTGGNGGDGIATHDTNVGFLNFGNNDIVYFDSQVNNSATQFFDARYTSMTDGATVGGVTGQNALVLGLVSSPAQLGSTAMVLLGLEGNSANTVYPSIVSLPDGSVGWANVWHGSSTAVLMG